MTAIFLTFTGLVHTRGFVLLCPIYDEADSCSEIRHEYRLPPDWLVCVVSDMLLLSIICADLICKSSCAVP